MYVFVHTLCTLILTMCIIYNIFLSIGNIFHSEPLYYTTSGTPVTEFGDLFLHVCVYLFTYVKQTSM